MRTNLLTLFFFSYYSRFTFFQCLYLFIMQCVCVFIFLPAFYICITFKKIFYPAFLPLYQCFYYYQLVTFLKLRFYFFGRFLKFVSAFLPFYLLFCLITSFFALLPPFLPYFLRFYLSLPAFFPIYSSLEKFYGQLLLTSPVLKIDKMSF